MKHFVMKRCLAIGVLLTSVCAHAGVNKWVDAEGKVHYSDTPAPPNVKSMAVNIPSASSGVAAQKTYTEREAERKKTVKSKEEAEQKVAQQQESDATKQKNCEGAKANLRTYESNVPIAAFNDKGESTRMDAETRQKNIEQTNKQISQYCN